MWKILGIIILQIASYASIVGLYFAVFPTPPEGRPTWHWVLLLAVAIFILLLIANDIREYRRNAPKAYKTDAQINAYMRRWVASGGRAVIFSRDLSWAHDKKTKDILIQKARRNELILCVEGDLPITAELKDQGATVIHYGGIHVPRSRFTIVDFEKEGARVAVGAKQHGVHFIQEYRNGEHPFFGVAEDLVKFLRAVDNQK